MFLGEKHFKLSVNLNLETGWQFLEEAMLKLRNQVTEGEGNIELHQEIMNHLRPLNVLLEIITQRPLRTSS